MARQSRAPVILLTRPLPQSQRFAAQMSARWPDVTCVVAPLMAPTFLTPKWPEANFAALVLTSETAVEAARRISATGIPLPTRAFCVGDHTATVAQAAGFDTLSARGRADDLVALIAAHPPAGPLLFLRGQDTTGDLEYRLNLAGTETVSAIVYAQSPQPFSPQATALLQGDDPVIVPLFSPRSAGLFVMEHRRILATAPLWLAAISPAVAQIAVGLTPARLQTALQPDSNAMVTAVAMLMADGMGS